LTTADSSDVRLFQVALCALPPVKLAPLLTQLSQYHSLLLPELTQLLVDGPPPLGINYRAVLLSEELTALQSHFAGTDALIFVIPPDPLCLLPECRAALFAIHQCLPPATPVVVLVDQAPSSCVNALKRPIEELQLANLVDVGVHHLGIYPVCTQTGEGLYDALWWLVSLFLAKLEDELSREQPSSVWPEALPVPSSKGHPPLPWSETGHSSKSSEPVSLKPSLTDDYVFSSGETYFDRLFATVALWKETWQAIRQQPLKKQQFLLRYERQVREVLQERSNARESLPNDC
jgi:hypothetical protein